VSSFQSAPAFNKVELAASTDIFGITRDSKEDYYTLITESLTSMQDEGSVKLPNGMTADMNTMAGMTTFSTYMQFLQADMEIIDNVFGFIKNLENKLDNLLSS
jgi:hypothetical protein